MMAFASFHKHEANAIVECACPRRPRAQRRKMVEMPWNLSARARSPKLLRRGPAHPNALHHVLTKQ